MLSSDLLRTKISRGKIEPLFCSLDFGNGTAYELANKLVIFFKNTHKNNWSKKELLKKAALLESEYDYKLVRGLFVLLERRSIFDTPTDLDLSPVVIRQKIFTESSKQGLALSAKQRQEIIQLIADQNSVSAKEIETIMWADSEENLMLKEFDFIDPRALLLWYNLSLAQTLLFKCMSMEFYLEGGFYWKQVLRNVKRFGLMYNLEYFSKSQSSQQNSDSLKCMLEGPLSLFKMTDRYGTYLAKLLPWIIRAPLWKINGSVIRKYDEGSKIYHFELSSNNNELLQPISDILYSTKSCKTKSNQNNENKNNDETNMDIIFDSSLEKKFEKLFLQYFNKEDDWKISREPNPLIADGKAMIPDFLFERFGKKVYFEIVGFWTQEYLKRKTAKLKAIFDKNHQTKNQDIDLIVGINSDLACSQIESISDDRVFTFKKEVPIKPILKHLEKIDKLIVTEKIKTTKIQLKNEESNIISIKEIAKKYKIPIETTLNLLSSHYKQHVVINKTYMIPNEKINHIKKKLEGVVNFTHACKILEINKIPESLQADLLSKLGYDVVWIDLDPNNAIITLKNL